MANVPNTGSSINESRKKFDSVARQNAETEASAHYDNSLVPLLWLLIPFIAVLVYGFLS